eukprot:3858536-Pleurochrysis_carterae.AAC.1
MAATRAELASAQSGQCPLLQKVACDGRAPEQAATTCVFGLSHGKLHAHTIRKVPPTVCQSPELLKNARGAGVCR